MARLLSSNHLNSMLRHLKQDTPLVKTLKQGYEARSRMKVDHRRQALLSAGHYSPLPPSYQSSPNTFNKIVYKKGYNRQYAPRHGMGSDRWYSDGSSSHSDNAARSSDQRPAAPTHSQKHKDCESRGSDLRIQPVAHQCRESTEIRRETKDCEVQDRQYYLKTGTVS